jgi:hypothetical protein
MLARRSVFALGSAGLIVARLLPAEAKEKLVVVNAHHTN